MEISLLYNYFKESTGVATDTRKINQGNIFFALKGPNFNANLFAGEAIEKGAKYAVVDDRSLADEKTIFYVPDTLIALQKLANYHRKTLNIPVIGLTGSNGKTTTKELIHCVLNTKFKVTYTQGNLNNHIGVPLTLLTINSETEIALIEMGANHLGEIKTLCEIAEPTHGLITNIGKAHIGTFGGFENIIRGKSELYDFLIKTRGIIWVNSGNPILSNMAKRIENPYFYFEKGDYYHCHLLDASPYLKIEAENGEIVQTKIPGRYNFENIAAALCIGKFFEVNPEKAHRALADFYIENNRSQITPTESNLLILDAYNANPSSMDASLANFAQMSMEKSKKVVILGDMFELGEEEQSEHTKLGEKVSLMDFDDVYFCGKAMAHAHQACVNSKYYSTFDDLKKYLEENPIVDAVILLKGSRGMGLERLKNLL